MLTPPGHWMFLAAPHIRKADYSEVRAARAFALVAMAVHDAAVGCWETKYFYYNPRPSHLDPELKTVIGLPNFPSYTSGHSTFSGSASMRRGNAPPISSSVRDRRTTSPFDASTFSSSTSLTSPRQSCTAPTGRYRERWRSYARR